MAVLNYSYNLSNRADKMDQDWESMAHALRGGLRVLRSGMDVTLDEAERSGYSNVDWADEFKIVRESIDEILKEVVGEK